MNKFLFPFLNPLNLILREAEGTGASTGSLISGAGDEGSQGETPPGNSADNSGEVKPEGGEGKTGGSRGNRGGPKEGEAPKEEEAKQETPAEPITMEAIELPENLEISEENQAAFLEVVNDPALSRAELVNKLISMQGEALTAQAAQMQEASMKAWTDLRAQWVDEARALPEIGGENLEKTLADIKSGLTAAGATKDAFEALNVTGAGDNPHLIQLMHKLAQPFLEKAPAGGKPVTTQADRAARMFPSMAKEK